METISLSDNTLRFKKRENLFVEVRINDITDIVAVSRSSFQYPFIGGVLGLIGLIGSLSIAIDAIKAGCFMRLFFLPKGPIIPFVFLASAYLLWILIVSPVIPWIIIRTNKKKYVIPVHDGTMYEVNELLGTVNELKFPN